MPFRKSWSASASKVCPSMLMLVVMIVELYNVDMDALPATRELTNRVENEFTGFIV
jgi:hypothetical protein